MTDNPTKPVLAVDPLASRLLLAAVDPFFILRGALIAGAISRTTTVMGERPIYLPGGARGWTNESEPKR